MSNLCRIEFDEAIAEPLLFQKSWNKLSLAQQTVLKIMYGQPLAGEELDLWSAFSGKGEYDDLGYLQAITEQVPYYPQNYADITLIIGRRAGKTSGISSFAVAYEALCGDHKSKVGDRQDPLFLLICQDLQTARTSLRQFVLDWLANSPIGKKELEHFGTSAITADSIRLKRAVITVGPPTIKLRGQAIAVCAMDELCVWPKDKEASNPDIEVERAVLPAMMQFYPYDKLIKVSTPMTEEGLLWQAANIGTRGELLVNPDERTANARRLVLRAPTAAMGNPKATRPYLIEQRGKDPESFPREYLAQFSKSVSGFLNTDLLRDSVAAGVRVRPPEGGQFYVATLDPAFRRDAFAFTIGHMEGGAFVQDYINAWRGSKDAPLRPGAVLDEITMVAMSYGIRLLVSDQYHSESLMEMALVRGLVIESLPMTGEVKHRMWSDFNSLLMQRKIVLLDHADLLDELMKMERVLTKFGNVQYAGGGRRDDLAMVTSLAVHKAMQLGEPTSRIVRTMPVSIVDQVRARVQRNARMGQESEGSWWVD